MSFEDIMRPLPDVGMLRAPSLGKTFYVDRLSSYASDSNEGTDPNHPLNTVQVAWDACTSLKNDYVFCINTRAEDDSITGTVTTAHIIGLMLNGAFSVNNIPRPSADTAMFTFPTAAIRSELAGFNMNGGANHGAVETSGSPSVLWIHHNVFGSNYAGSATPKYGIYSVHGATGMVHSTIEDNVFYGTTNTAVGKIDANAIYINSATMNIIRRNVILGIPGVAMLFTACYANSILDNRISCYADGNYGISFDANSTGNWIDGNHVNYSEAAQSTTPFIDATTNMNNWGANWVGDAVDFP